MEDCAIDAWSTVGDEENRDGISISMGLQEIEESGKSTRIACEHEANGFRSICECTSAQQKDV